MITDISEIRNKRMLLPSEMTHTWVCGVCFSLNKSTSYLSNRQKKKLETRAYTNGAREQRGPKHGQNEITEQKKDHRKTSKCYQ